MSFSDVQFIFNRALSLTFNKKKLLLVFFVLALCGIMVVFFRALSLNAGEWVIMSLSFLPIFLCVGVLLSTGIILIRIYHDEIKQKPFRYRDILANSWEMMIGASYFSIPFILTYLVLWMLLGIFLLLKETPTIGGVFGVILSFGPFLINLGSLALSLLSVAMLFLVTPVLALKGMNRLRISQVIVNRLKKDMFSNIFLGIIAVLPLLSLFGFLILAWVLTGTVCYACSDPTYIVMQWFFMMIPFTALLSPAIVFFFNFATEAHVLIQRRD